jgi:hypothetical protein
VTSRPRKILLVLFAAALLVLAGAPVAQARLPAGFVGMSAGDVFAQGGSYREQNMGAIHRAGVRLLREPFSWQDIEPGPGRFDFSRYDAYVAAAARKRLRILPVLFGEPSFYSSRPAGGGDSNRTYPPRDVATMARFAAALVARYGPNGTLWRQNPGVRKVPIRAWQIWNEPSLRQYRISPRGYVRLLGAVGRAIKQVDRRAEIVTAGLPPSTQRGAVRLTRYITQLYKAGGKRVFDTLGLNSYARNAGELNRLLRSIRQLMNRRRDRRARIWITELGWCDRGVRHRFCVGARRVSRNIKASFRVIKRKRGAYRLRGFVYFAWRDARPYGRGDMWGLHTGLLKLNGRRKASYRVFSRTVRRLF